MKLKFSTISEQVAAALRREIKSRTWTTTLPGERQLAARFQVSRKTLRRALAELRQEGLLTTRTNDASFIESKLSRPPLTDRIALLLPDPLESARPYTVLWVNRLMAFLQDRGLQLEIFHGTKYYGTHTGRSLGRLTSSHPARCWILARSNRPMQEWFVHAGIPALISGSTHAGISLPSVDIDHRALCRHAASVLLREGHRRVAIFLDRAGQAGDAESEQGFLEGVSSLDRQATMATLQSDNERSCASTIRQVKKLLAMADPPTGWLVSNSNSYLTVLSYLGALGMKVPGDISLICRDEEPFLKYLHPTPVRYAASPAKFAIRINQALKRIERGDTSAFSLRLMPDLVVGASLGKVSTAR